MKRVLIVFFLLFASFIVRAQQLDWNVRFNYLFDNYEYAYSKELFDKSQTVNAVRLTPEIGVRIPQKDRTVSHRVMLGIDLFKDFGEGLKNWDVFREFTIYYNVEAGFRNGGHFSAVAGCYPRSFTEGLYDGPFYSDKFKFYDPNLEGMLFKYRNDRIFAELGLDWMGKLGNEENPYRRERFQIFTSGSWNFAGKFSLCWAGTFYHFANSPVLDNIVDNNILNPWLEWAPDTRLDQLKIGAGGIFTYQWDREIEDKPRLPAGFYSRQTFSKWNVFIRNSFYWGADLMPLYDSAYKGVKYGADLYFADERFHTICSCGSWNDKLSVAYEPEIAKFLHVYVGAEFHFGTPFPSSGVSAFRGWKQTAGVKFDLQTLVSSARQSSDRKIRLKI